MAEKKESAEAAARTIRRVTRMKHSAEEKVRIVLEGIRIETSIAARKPARQAARIRRRGLCGGERAPESRAAALPVSTPDVSAIVPPRDGRRGYIYDGISADVTATPSPARNNDWGTVSGYHRRQSILGDALGEPSTLPS